MADAGLVPGPGLIVAEAFAARLRSGMAHVNGQTINDTAYAPMGGLGGSGNGGRHGGHWNLDEFTCWQWVSAVPATPPAASPPG